MRYIAVLLTAILSLSCAANAGGIWGEPAEIAPTTGSTSDPLVGQANVTRPPAASSSKTNGLRNGGAVSGPSPDGKRSATKFDVSAIQDGKAEDPALQSGDQLLAGTSAIKQGFNTILKGLPLAGTAKGVAGAAQ